MTDTPERKPVRPDPEPERTLARPVEEVAKALSTSKVWPAVFEPGTSAVAAAVAITRLRKLGFINDIGLEAIKAEEGARYAVPGDGK